MINHTVICTHWTCLYTRGIQTFSEEDDMHEDNTTILGFPKGVIPASRTIPFFVREADKSYKLERQCLMRSL